MMCVKNDLTDSFFKCIQKIRHNSKNIFQTMPAAEFHTMFSIRSLTEEENTDAIPVSRLLDKNSVTPQAMSKMLKTLETKGYIERHTSQANRRNTLVTITPKGQRLLEVTEENAITFVSEMEKKIGADKMNEFFELSDMFFSALEEVRDNFKEKEVDYNG